MNPLYVGLCHTLGIISISPHKACGRTFLSNIANSKIKPLPSDWELLKTISRSATSGKLRRGLLKTDYSLIPLSG